MKIEINSLEEEIKRLEASLEGGDGDDSDDNSENDSDDDVGMLVETDANGKVVRLVSSLVTEQIAPLPKEKLPLPMCSRGGGASRAASSLSSSSSSSSSRKGVRFSDEGEGAGAGAGATKRPKMQATNKSAIVGAGASGLEATVREMLANYVPSSAEKRPFWCRICRSQSTDLQQGALQVS